MVEKRLRVSADIGGTFTDLIFYDISTGEYQGAKILSTPENLSNAIINGINKKITDYAAIDFFVHGTTSGLNAFLERKGAKVALLCTKGFRDIYEIGRGNRPPIYDIRYKKPKTLLERADVFEIDERIMANGQVLRPVSIKSLAAVVENIKKGGYTSIAVCLINAYNNPAHEIKVEEYLKSHLEGYSISLSHGIVREWREYERTSTTVLNAYIAPIVQEYLEFLEARMLENGFGKQVHIMQSGGGIITSELAKKSPIQTLLSGPVGGAVGNESLAKLIGYQNLIGVDMGGTSYDVSMIVGGKPDLAYEVSLEGFPILTPMINIQTIGAGGGSIAWIEAGGLRVGPRSAGASPGPACYGNNGTEPTITDAKVVLGHLDPNGFLGGNMVLNKNAAIDSVKTIADQLNMTVDELAQGICDIADAKMADAIRQITVRKGIDPREFVLVAFGGAGPMLACTTADELDMDRVLIPEKPGNFSAWGMLQSDIRQDLSRTLQCSMNQLDMTQIEDTFREMSDEAMDLLIKQQIPNESMDFIRSIDMRYAGQEYTVRIDMESSVVDIDSLDKLSRNFHEIHKNIYGFNSPNGELEIVNLRLVGLGYLDKKLKEKSTIFDDSIPAPSKKQEAIFKGERHLTAIYDRELLKYGQSFAGPAIIRELTATTVVPPDWYGIIDEFHNILVMKKKEI